MFVKDKVAVVNYVGFDFGICIARDLLNNGLKGICLLDNNSTKSRKLIKILEKEFGKNRAILIITNFSNESEIEAAFKETVETFGNIDIAINSGGLSNEYDGNLDIDVNSNQLATPCINAPVLVEKYLSKSCGAVCIAKGSRANLVAKAITRIFEESQTKQD
ncbi:short chain dehydrogenase [Popillia japonica]|uniref:Short chain dehydrogenase n=1 Tax=Popillia japonica TaxID=7064 RepID=A0AAW1M000_POPJA